MQEVVTIDMTPQNARVADALGAENGSVRLRTTLMVGSNPDPVLLETLVERCAVEPDFYVRDMLCWALTRLPPEITLPRIRQELDSERTQARSQALHLLSKIGDRSTWPWITRVMLRDADDGVARTAWRVAVALVPDDEEEKQELADELGAPAADTATRIRLVQALVELAGPAAQEALHRPAQDEDRAVALVASAFVGVLEEQSRQDRAEDP